MVGMGMREHQIVQRFDIERMQVVEQCLLSLGGAGVDQAIRTVLTNQNGIPLPDIQHIHDGAAGCRPWCAFLRAERYAKRSAQLPPVWQRAAAVRQLNDKGRKQQQSSQHSGCDAPALLLIHHIDR